LLLGLNTVRSGLGMQDPTRAIQQCHDPWVRAARGRYRAADCRPANVTTRERDTVKESSDADSGISPRSADCPMPGVGIHWHAHAERKEFERKSALV
jgi:hypothetical protein